MAETLQVFTLGFDDLEMAESVIHDMAISNGMKFRIKDIFTYCKSVTGSPYLSIGITNSGTEIVGHTELTTNLGALTLKSNMVTADDRFSVRIANGLGHSAESVALTIIGYLSAPPDSSNRSS